MKHITVLIRFMLVSWLVLSVTSLAGCGFHMRGSQGVEMGFDTVYLQSDGADSLVPELRRQLRYSAVKLTNAKSAAQVVLNISDEQIDRRVLSVDPVTGKVREYELGYEVYVTVTDITGKELMTTQPVGFVRDYIFDETAVLSTYEQDTIIRTELIRDAANAVVMRLQAVEFSGEATGEPQE
jgi:LPS-assembly lipoprotein